MKREELVALGLTAEQIESVMAEHGKAIQQANAKAEQYKTDAQKVKELQKVIDEMNDSKLSEIELANKEKQKALDSVAELQKQIVAMNNKTKLAELGIVGEQADKLIGENGTLDFGVLGQIISDRETKASSAKEKELLDGTPNPTGGNDGKDEASDGDKLAQEIGKTHSVEAKAFNDVMQNYI